MWPLLIYSACTKENLKIVAGSRNESFADTPLPMNKSLRSSLEGRHLAKMKEQGRQSEHDVNMIIEESKESDAS